MDETEVDNSFKAIDNLKIKDIPVCLRNSEQGTHKLFYFKPPILASKSKFFADKLSSPSSSPCIEIHCSVLDYDHYVNLLSHLHLPASSLIDTWKSVNSALGVLQVAVSLQCDEIVKACVDYLEAVPWEDKEEEEILKIVPELGEVASPILARVKPLDPNSTKNVFLAAVRYAMSISSPRPPFGDEIRVSAQEQIDYMLGEDEETSLVTADDEVKSEIRNGLTQMFSAFKKKFSTLLSNSELCLETSENNIVHNSTQLNSTTPTTTGSEEGMMNATLFLTLKNREEVSTRENNILHSLCDFDWLCDLLPKINLMADFVMKWVEISSFIIRMMDHPKLESSLWSLKLKLIEINGKVLDAVAYGNVILPPICRVHLLKTWLPYIQKMKLILDSMGSEETGYPYRIDEDLSQSIQGAIVSLIVALPSNDQADILADWMGSEKLGYPDLTEAFEIWCYRSKSSKRRLVEGLDSVTSGSVSSGLSF